MLIFKPDHHDDDNWTIARRHEAMQRLEGLSRAEVHQLGAMLDAWRADNPLPPR